MPVNLLSAAVGRILAEHRQQVLRVSRKALAEQHGMAANTLREVELGLGNPTVGRVEALARDVYGIEIRVVPASGPLAAVAAHPIARAQ